VSSKKSRARSAPTAPPTPTTGEGEASPPPAPRRGSGEASPPPRTGKPEIARRDWILIAILLVAAVARLTVLLALRNQPLLQPRPGLDSGVYLDLARRVAAGDLLCGDRVFFLSPFYVYFAGAVLALSGGSVLVLQTLQALLGVAAVWLVADTARIWFGRHGAWIAAGLACLTGYFAFQESILLQSAVDPFLTALGLWALARAWTRPHWRRFLVAGAILGLHALNRPNVLLWATAAAALTCVAWPLRGGETGTPAPHTSGARRAWHAGLLVAGLLVALFPVALRNYFVAGEFAAVSSHGGLNFYIGNNARADGTYRPVPGITPSIEGQDRDMRQVAGQAAGRQVTDVEASSWFYRRAVDWISQHPGAAVALFARKLAYVFNADDIPLNDSYAYYATDVVSPLRVLFVGPWLLLPLGLAGIWFGRPGGRPSAWTPAEAGAWWRLAAFIPVYALAVVVFFVTGRYRLPILVACCVTGAGWAVAVMERATTNGWRSVAGPLGVLLLLGTATNVGLGLDNGLGGWRAEMILHDIANGNEDEADALLARTEPMYPNRALLLYRVGRAYRQRGEDARALAVLERAKSLSPERKELDLEIGEALVQLGRAPEAVPHLKAARDLDGREDEARMALARALAVVGRRDEALATLTALRAPEKLDPQSQAVAGRMALELGAPAVAEPFLARAVQAAPGSPETREAHGLALAAIGRRPEATAALEQASRLDPSNVGVRMNLAILYAEAGRIREARQQATDALRLRPDDDRVRQFLATLPPGR
jgi:Flp pilus assembly protein TadD